MVGTFRPCSRQLAASWFQSNSLQEASHGLSRLRLSRKVPAQSPTVPGMAWLATCPMKSFTLSPKEWVMEYPVTWNGLKWPLYQGRWWWNTGFRARETMRNAHDWKFESTNLHRCRSFDGIILSTNHRRAMSTSYSCENLNDGWN